MSSAKPTTGFAGLPAEYAIPNHAASLVEGQAYCRRLARSHYENFSVATWLLPAHLRQHFCNLYAYCRISDDLGDEVGDPQTALALLDEWESELNATYLSLVRPAPRDIGGDVEKLRPEASFRNPAEPRHPVFVALRETIIDFDIPREPFSDLLVAFRHDQRVKRYDTFQNLLRYCHYSANPVGHLVLYICGYRDEHRHELSDYTCTALQLANFWQDVALDYGKGRVYLPLEDLRRFQVREEVIASQRATPEFLELMRFEVERARQWFERGLPLARCVDLRLRTDIELFTRGGQAILNAIERQEYDVLRRRPVISAARKLALLLRAALGRLR